VELTETIRAFPPREGNRQAKRKREVPGDGWFAECISSPRAGQRQLLIAITPALFDENVSRGPFHAAERRRGWQ